MGQLEQFTPRHRQKGDALSVKSLKTTPIPGKISLLLNNHDAAAILNRARAKILFLCANSFVPNKLMLSLSIKHFKTLYPLASICLPFILLYFSH